jgi:ubiquinone/menaquinone biosynthesis C-methylase UbiE
MVENWLTVYTSRPDIYSAFSRYEDEHNKALKAISQRVTFSQKIVLEIGCGPGKYTSLLAPATRAYLAIDISEPLLALAKSRCEHISNLLFLRSNATHMHIASNTIDVVFASWAFSAIIPEVKRARAIRETLRVLKPGGEAWLLENHWTDEFTRLRGLPLNYDESEIRPLIEQYGFNLVTVVDTHFAFPSLEEAERVCGFIFADAARRFFTRHQRRRVHHRIAVLHLVNKF